MHLLVRMNITIFFFRLQITEDGLQLNGHEKSSTEALEYAAVCKQDTKCRSTVLSEALAKVHISMAEAT